MSPTERADATAADPLADLPIHSEGPAGRFAEPLAVREVEGEIDAAAETAPLTSRAVAFAEDLAGTSLAVTLALVAAVAVTGRAPRLPGISWAAAFGVVYSFVFVALPLAFTMIVALFLVHAKDPWKVKELAAVYLCVYLSLILMGAGEFSLDGLISKNKQRKRVEGGMLG